MVVEDVELRAFDLRCESHRMENPALEARLLVSIHARGAEEPVER